MWVWCASVTRRQLWRAAIVSLLVCPGGVTDAPLLAQQPAAVFVDAPPAPVAPATIARDDKRRATVRAVRISAPLKLDGRLEEEFYQTITPVGDFIQQTPVPNAPATEKTDVWILYDDTNLYISMMLHETEPGRRIGNEMRRDAQGLTNDDNIMLVLDTFYDRRNAFNFQVSSTGGMRDQLITDTLANGSWNTIWRVKVADAEGGQSFEMAIPFKSLRYPGSGPQVWGFNARRTTKWKNELSYLNPNPVAYGPQGINILATAATLVGVETPARTMNLELKPYGLASVTTDRTAAVPFDNDAKVNGGFDFKYGLTRGLTTDFTVNTDFAQVEEDVQQVNLTRFSLFFPEKRDFFLEGLGNFGFAGQGTGSQSDGASDVPTLFFSRRIGLSNGQVIPVRAGGRMTGRARGFEMGFLNIQTAEKLGAGAPSTNFTAGRVRRQILRRSNIGVITTLRDPDATGDRNVAVGADANLRFYQNIESNFYYAQTSTTGREGDDNSYRARFAYVPDRYGFDVEHLKVGSNFNPEVGFVRRADMRTTSLQARYSPRFRGRKHLRRMSWVANYDHITNSEASRLENRNVQGDYTIEFHNSDSVTMTYVNQHELLPANFRISPGVIVPGGEYDYQTVRASYTLGNQRWVSGTVSGSTGQLYGGTRTTASYNGRLSFSSHFVMEPSISINKVELPYGDFSANLLSTRIIFTPGQRTQLASLLQWNQTADTLTSSVRLRWEYTPGSELFVVFTDGRNTPESLAPGLLNRSFAVKLTRLLRF